MDRAEDVQPVWDIVKELCTCMVVTETPERLQGRPMTVKASQSAGELRFLASASSAVVAEIRATPRVNLCFMDAARQAWLSISGKAVVAQDSELVASLWDDSAAVFFSGPGDPDIAVSCVVPNAAEYWTGGLQEAGRAWRFAPAPAHDEVTM